MVMALIHPLCRYLHVWNTGLIVGQLRNICWSPLFGYCLGISLQGSPGQVTTTGSPKKGTCLWLWGEEWGMWSSNHVKHEDLGGNRGHADLMLSQQKYNPLLQELHAVLLILSSPLTHTFTKERLSLVPLMGFYELH